MVGVCISRQSLGDFQAGVRPSLGPPLPGNQMLQPGPPAQNCKYPLIIHLPGPWAGCLAHLREFVIQPLKTPYFKKHIYTHVYIYKGLVKNVTEVQRMFEGLDSKIVGDF